MNSVGKVLLGGVILLAGASAAHAATLSLSPAQGTYQVGETFTVDIMLDTEGGAIDGVDINALNYDPRVLEIVDADRRTEGAQIKPGTLMSSTVANDVDSDAGRIAFSQVTGSAATFRNETPQPLASIEFRARRSGVARVTFDYEAGNTTDANVAAVGADVLTDVTEGRYEIDGASLWDRFLAWLQRLLGTR